MFKKLLLTASLLMFLAAPVAFAHEEEIATDPGLLPGNPLYFLEVISEGFGSLFTFGSVAKAERSLLLAEERLIEAHALADKGKYQRAERSVKKYEAQFTKALEKTSDVKEEAQQDGAEEIVLELEALLAEISDATAKHQDVLVSIFQELSEGIVQDIEDAVGVNVVGNDANLDIQVEQLSGSGVSPVGFGEIGVLLDDLFGEEFDFEGDLFDGDHETDGVDDEKDHDMNDDGKDIKEHDGDMDDDEDKLDGQPENELEDDLDELDEGVENPFEDLSDELEDLENLENFKDLNI